MIAHLHGVIKTKETDSVTLDVGGVGYQVFVSAQTLPGLPAVGKPLFLHIHPHIREDQWTLFGFAEIEEKEVFQQLLKVNGVGPKTALHILSGLPLPKLCQAIADGDMLTLKKIPGVGQKVAERILLDLKGKIGLPAKSKGGFSAASKILEEALSALTHLGYTPGQAEAALQKVERISELALEEVVKRGLRILARI